MKKLLLLSLTVLSFGVYSDISADKMAEIEQRVSSMGIKELQDRRSFLIKEESSLFNQLDTTQNPSTNKAMSERLASVRAELSAIQKALLALVGAGAIASITDRVLLVSSKQLAKILGKKNDSSLRSQRSLKTGFKFYTDKLGP